MLSPQFVRVHVGRYIRKAIALKGQVRAGPCIVKRGGFSGPLHRRTKLLRAAAATVLLGSYNKQGEPEN